MLKSLGLAQLTVKFGPDLIEKLVKTSGIAGGHGPHAAMAVHGHECKLCAKGYALMVEKTPAEKHVSCRHSKSMMGRAASTRGGSAAVGVEA